MGVRTPVGALVAISQGVPDDGQSLARASCLTKPWNELADALLETLGRNGYPHPVAQVKFWPQPAIP